MKKATFSTIFRISCFFWRTTFLIPFAESLPFIAATFSEDLLFYNIPCQKSYYFTATLLFHSYTSYYLDTNWVSLVPVTCSLSGIALSCVSTIAQIQIKDKVYLISWLCKVLSQCFFVMNLLFEWATFSQSLLFKDPKFLYVFARSCSNISPCFLQGLFLQKMLFLTVFHSYTFSLSLSNQQ